jgi:O-antigen ligase
VPDIPFAEPREESRAARRGGLAEVLLRCGIVALLIAAPLFFGATSTYAGLALVCAAWLLLTVFVARGAAQGRLYLPSNPVTIPAALLLAFAAVHWLTGIAAGPLQGQQEWLRWTAYAALAVVAVGLFDSPQRVRAMLHVMAMGGALVALLGIAQHLTGEGKIYWLIEPPYGGWSFGPYPNRNHFAGLMELWMPVALGLALLEENRSWMRWASWAAVVVMGCAVILSGSRAGLLVMIAQFVFFAAWVVSQRSGRRPAVAFAAVVVSMLMIALALGGTQGFERVLGTIQPSPAQLDEATGNRIPAWRDTFTLFRQNWLLGAGLESFGRLFPSVRSFSTDKYWSHAHNDFLQFLAELGLVGGILAAWALVAGGRCALRNLSSQAGSANAPLLAGLACACAGFLLHGWLDFNFHVPANAATFAVLAALLVRRGWNEEL